MIVVRRDNMSKESYYLKIKGDQDCLWITQKIASVWLRNQLPLIGRFLG